MSESTVLLSHHLKKLKLPSMLREYAKMAELCRADRTDYQTYLLRLCERELTDREQRAAERRVKAAKFPVLKTLDMFDFAAQPSINQQLARELLRGEYIDRCRQFPGAQQPRFFQQLQLEVKRCEPERRAKGD